MKNSTNVKTLAVTSPAAIVDDAAFTTNTIDTLGFAQLTIIVMLGALDIALAAFKVREGDASDMSDAADITGADFSVSPATLPAATADNNLYAVHIDLRGRKRYIDLSLTGGNGTSGTYAAAIAQLSNPQTYPSSAADRGFAAELFA